MPYKIVKKGNQYCVAKKDTGEVLKGACHAERADAINQMQAIYANESNKKKGMTSK